MKKIILINSHMYSGSEALYFSLNSHPLIQGCKRAGKLSGYTSNLDLFNTASKKHKSKLKKSFYLDEVSFNHLLSTKIDYTKLIVINFLRRPKETLESIVHFKKVNPVFALRHYQYRMNRMYQVLKKSNKCTFVTFESLDDESMEAIQNFIGLDRKVKLSKEMLSSFKSGFKKDTIPKEVIRTAEERYEQYHFLFKDHSPESFNSRN